MKKKHKSKKKNKNGAKALQHNVMKVTWFVCGIQK